MSRVYYDAVCNYCGTPVQVVRYDGTFDYLVEPGRYCECPIHYADERRIPDWVGVVWQEEIL